MRRSFSRTDQLSDSGFIMRYYLYLLIAAVCEAGIIKRGIDPYFPHLHTVYHGHGATSYQNVQIDNHDNVPIATNYIDHDAEIQDFEHHEYHQPIIVPIVQPHDDVDDIDISDSASYEEFITGVELKPENYFDHYDDAHDYDLHLRK